jgi:hypothetical protein
MQADPMVLYIAGYAALVSTLVLTWNIIQWYLSKGKIKFDCSLTYMVGNEGLFLAYKIANTGEKSVVLSSINGTYKNGGRVSLISPGLPKRLEPKEAFFEYRGAPCMFVNPGLKDLFVVDSLDKAYKLKRREVKKLEMKMVEYMKEIGMNRPLGG